jgi:hypothetical protein
LLLRFAHRNDKAKSFFGSENDFGAKLALFSPLKFTRGFFHLVDFNIGDVTVT